MTTPKNAPKKGAARGPRLTTAELRRRNQTQEARRIIAGMDDSDMAANVAELATKQPAIFDYELLIAVAHRLNEPRAVESPTGPGVYYQPQGYLYGERTSSPLIFKSPTADSVEEEGS